LSGTSLGNDTFKIRLAIKSKNKGKSGGVRVITYVITDDMEVYLLTVYDKSEIDSVENRMLQEIIERIK
jgi:hypothetical protein